jgi:hypothetical protein
MRCLVFISILLFSCNSENEAKVKIQIHVEDEKETLPSLDNPAIFLGTSFGEFFQVLHKTGQYSLMYAYSSSETKLLFSKEQLLSFYQKMLFSYPLKLKALKNSNGQEVLLYQTSIDATKRTIQMNVIVESDTCRIIFVSLNYQTPFIGM